MAERKLRRGIEEQIKAALKVRGLKSITYLVILKELDKIYSKIWLDACWWIIPPPLFCSRNIPGRRLSILPMLTLLKSPYL